MIVCLFSAAMILTCAFFALVFLYYREDIRAYLSHRLNLWIYRMQSVWADAEPECPEWADPVLWRQSNHF